MKLVVGLLLALLAPSSAPRSEPASPALPWLYNMDGVVAVNVGDAEVPLEMEAEVDPSCDEAMPTGLSLVADVARAAGPETILASFAHGVRVYGSEGQLIASTPGFPCEGSADEIEVLAVGEASGAPTIVIAATTGGRREQLTWLGMYRVGSNGRLDAMFSGAVERREDGNVRSGSVTVLRKALLVHDPLGGVELWELDPADGVYVPRGSVTGEERPLSS